MGACWGGVGMKPIKWGRIRWWMEWHNTRWFNIGGPKIYTPIHIGTWEFFNRHCKSNEHYWGLGVGQVGSRFLFYVGSGGISILFMGKLDVATLEGIG